MAAKVVDEQIIISKNDYNDLVKKVETLAKKIESLLLENQELRVKYLNIESNDLAKESPRKIAKTYNVTNDLTNVGGAAAIFGINKKKKSPSLKTNTVHSDKQSSSSNSMVKKNKEFQIIGDNAMKVRKNMLSAGCKEFIVKQTSANTPVKINVIANEADKVRKILLDNKSSFHEYKMAEEKHSCFIIKGLVGMVEDDLSELKSQLIECGLPKELLLTFHVTAAMRAAMRVNPQNQQNKNSLVKLVLPPKFDYNILHTIKSLNHVAVKFEAFKSKNILQCRNCQRYGHAASGCRHPHRCVKCGKNHLRDECPRTTDENHPLYCCNCGGNHTANNLVACSYFNELMAKKSADVGKKTVPVNVSNVGAKSSRRRLGVSFADVASGGSISKAVSAADFKQASLEGKIDKLLSIVMNHELLLTKLIANNG